MIDIINYNDELSKELIAKAKAFLADKKDSYEFMLELGWSDWMKELCTDSDSLQSNDGLTERDSDRIDEYLDKIWNKAQAETDLQ